MARIPAYTGTNETWTNILCPQLFYESSGRKNLVDRQSTCAHFAHVFREKIGVQVFNCCVEIRLILILACALCKFEIPEILSPQFSCPISDT